MNSTSKEKEKRMSKSQTTIEPIFHCVGRDRENGGGVHPSNNRKFPVTVSRKDKIFLKFYINL
jgi:hypothetical protein